MAIADGDDAVKEISVSGTRVTQGLAMKFTSGKGKTQTYPSATESLSHPDCEVTVNVTS